MIETNEELEDVVYEQLEEVPEYQCFKKVRALKITEIKSSAEQDKTNICFEFPFQPYTADMDFMNKHNPKVDGYIVFYENGYISYSPAEPFEKGYVSTDQGKVLDKVMEIMEKNGYTTSASKVMLRIKLLKEGYNIDVINSIVKKIF